MLVNRMAIAFSKVHFDFAAMKSVHCPQLSKDFTAAWLRGRHTVSPAKKEAAFFAY